MQSLPTDVPCAMHGQFATQEEADYYALRGLVRAEIVKYKRVWNAPEYCSIDSVEQELWLRLTRPGKGGGKCILSRFNPERAAFASYVLLVVRTQLHKMHNTLRRRSELFEGYRQNTAGENDTHTCLPPEYERESWGTVRAAGNHGLDGGRRAAVVRTDRPACHTEPVMTDDTARVLELLRQTRHGQVGPQRGVSTVDILSCMVMEDMSPVEVAERFGMDPDIVRGRIRSLRADDTVRTLVGRALALTG